MTKYRLKDADLQHHLDAISSGEFSEALRSGIEFDKDGFAVVPFGSSKHDNNKALITGKFTVTLYKDEVYELADYDPNAWNNYPETQPPMDLHMRVETATGFKCCAEFDGEDWMYRSVGENGVQGLRVLKNVVRYRPWSKP